jgi:hypothetical protein
MSSNAGRLESGVRCVGDEGGVRRTLHGQACFDVGLEGVVDHGVEERSREGQVVVSTGQGGGTRGHRVEAWWRRHGTCGLAGRRERAR